MYAKSKRERNGHQSSRRGWASGVGLDESAGEAASLKGCRKICAAPARHTGSWPWSVTINLASSSASPVFILDWETGSMALHRLDGDPSPALLYFSALIEGIGAVSCASLCRESRCPLCRCGQRSL